MSKQTTEIFACRVTLGDRSYAAGEPVPLGGRNGLSPEEAESLRAAFGAAPPPAPGEGGLKERLAAADAQAARLREALARAEKDNAVLAARIGELDPAANP